MATRTIAPHLDRLMTATQKAMLPSTSTSRGRSDRPRTQARSRSSFLTSATLADLVGLRHYGGSVR